MLSHELRNPLGAILNTCAVLGRRKNFAKNLQGPIAIVTRQARQMAELLDDLLDVSRITTGKIKLEKAPVELSQIADEAVESQQSLAASRGQRLAVTYCDEPLQVFGDRSRLVQVVVNLLNNAIKYTGDGGTISVLLEKHGRLGRIRVKDNGVGLEPEQIESLFEMFAQKDATLDRSGGGMGLGLHLVRKLVDFHSGRVIGQSEGLGKGSEFIVELPLSARKLVEPRAPRLTKVSAQRSKIKRIVVVEDIDDARKMLVALLEADNYQVFAAADGEAGLAMILRERPDLAIVDIGLPKLDGYEVARRVRQQIPADALRLVALTGYGQDSDHENVMSAGFDTHLVKPLNHTRLEKILAGM
jgi:two-component system CheB/CheR fusion protein